MRNGGSDEAIGCFIMEVIGGRFEDHSCTIVEMDVLVICSIGGLARLSSCCCVTKISV